MSGRTPKVNIGSDKNRLFLHWSYQGKRYRMSVHLADTKTNRLRLKETIVLQIEADMETGQFDPTLDRYKPHKETGKKYTDLTSHELYQEWMNYKATHTDPRNVQWLGSMLRHLREYFQDKKAKDITEKDTQYFFNRFKNTGLDLGGIKRRLSDLSSCWGWAVKEHYLPNNPWLDLNKLIKVPKKRKRKPFTTEETNRILSGSTDLDPYKYAFIKFLFATGCRVGEAIGLRWSDLNEDCSICTIGEQLTKGERKPTKTGEERILYLAPTLQKVLIDLKAYSNDMYSDNPNDLVFLANGEAIDLEIFRERIWKPLLKKVKVPYRTPYNTRHTFISHAVDKKLDVVTIAEMTGHDPKTLFDYYASSLRKHQMPEI